LAIATIKAANMIGLSLPDDLSIIAIGDSRSLECVMPPISGLHLDRVMMGKKAASMLVELIQGKKVRRQEVICKMEFVNRGSISTPR
jgi:LacI family transcriptional regulator